MAPRIAGTIWGTARLVHLFPTLVVVTTSGVLVLVAHGGGESWSVLLRGLGIVALSQVAVGSLNDVVDREHDRTYQTSKPIACGLISTTYATAVVIVSLVLIVPLALTFGVIPCILVFVGTGGGVAYDVWLKFTPFSVVGYLIGFLSLITWIWTIAGHFTSQFLVVYPLGAVALVGAHLANSFPDLESDEHAGQKGLSSVLGAAWTYRVILASLSILALTTFVADSLTKSWVTLPLALVGTAAGIVGVHRCSTPWSDHSERVQLFRFTALATAILSVNCLIVLTRISH